MGERGAFLAIGRSACAALFLDSAGMLVVMTVEAQQLPVTAVGRVVIVVVISVVHSQLA